LAGPPPAEPNLFVTFPATVSSLVGVKNNSPHGGNPMRVTIFGATGKVGTFLVDHALQAGDDVTAVVRDPARLKSSSHGTPRVITADVMDPGSIAPALVGADAVISAIGPVGRGPTTVIADSARSIITAMASTGAKRLAATGSGAQTWPLACSTPSMIPAL
jgi:putative NADH-flavin reductase